ncbi:MAG: hypothetical protein BJ554DRAFT_7742, partial [Olpidium bornovanus]
GGKDQAGPPQRRAGEARRAGGGVGRHRQRGKACLFFFFFFLAQLPPCPPPTITPCGLPRAAVRLYRFSSFAGRRVMITGQSVATVLVRMKVDDQQEDLEQAISSQYYSSAVNEAALPGNVVGAPDVGNMTDLAESVAEELKREWYTQAARPSTTPANASTHRLQPAAENGGYKSPPAEPLRPSVDEDERSSSARVPVSDLKPLPFQTLHPSVLKFQEKSQQRGEGAQSGGQIDWLEDVDDVSGRASEIVSSLRGSDDGARSPIGGAAHLTGGLPHVDVGEALDDASLDDASRQQLPQDFMRAYARNAHARNKVGDHDYGYGDSRPQEREQLKAKHIPYVDPKAVRAGKKQRPGDRPAQQPASEVGGTMDELSRADDAGIVGESAARTAGHRAHRKVPPKTVSVGEAASRARSKEGAEHASDRPGKR